MYNIMGLTAGQTCPRIWTTIFLVNRPMLPRSRRTRALASHSSTPPPSPPFASAGSRSPGLSCLGSPPAGLLVRGRRDPIEGPRPIPLNSDVKSQSESVLDGRLGASLSTGPTRPSRSSARRMFGQPSRGPAQLVQLCWSSNQQNRCK